MTSIADNKGSATILIVLMAGVMISVGLAFNWLVREHIKASEGLKNKTEAILKARSAYELLIYLIMNGKITRNEILLLDTENITELRAIPLNGKRVALAENVFVKIQDTNSLVSLVNPDQLLMERLFRQIGKVDDAAVPVESLLDWIDTDDFKRVSGAEKSHYQEPQSSYAPRNYAFQYKEEVALIRGVGPDVYRKIEPFLTILPSTGFNPNTAGDEVLKIFLSLTDESLSDLKDYMSRLPVVSEATLFSLTGRRLQSMEDRINFFPSRFLEVTVQVGSPKTLYKIKSGFDRLATSISPYRIVYWHEE